MSEPVYALITGGGTGGHTYPAVAVAQELVRRGHPRESVRFIGGIDFAHVACVHL